MIEIIPAVMPKDWYDFEDTVNRVAQFVSTIQIDVMDGKFVPTRSWPYIKREDEYFNRLQEEEIGLPHWQNVDYEVDLMIEKPEEEINKWILAGMSRLIVHLESTTKIQDIVRDINERFAYPELSQEAMNGKSREIELGIALNPDTPLHTVTEFLEDIDFVQFMGIAKIGRQGEPFDERVIDRVREFHNAHPEVIISIDGGVNFDTAPMLVEAGVKRLVSGSAILQSDNPVETISHLKKITSGIE